jgi:hypothetical protein
MIPEAKVLNLSWGGVGTTVGVGVGATGLGAGKLGFTCA